MESTIIGKQFDAERALYNLRDTHVKGCIFDGPADGESALKEARNIRLTNCRFSLRYPLWHVEGLAMAGCSMDERARAALWYTKSKTPFWAASRPSGSVMILPYMVAKSFPRSLAGNAAAYSWKTVI